jgi:hypothetical protein
MMKRSLALAAAALSGVMALSAPASAAVVYKSDPTGDTTGSRSTVVTRKNADIRKIAVWKESSRIFVKVWVVDLTSGISGSARFEGAMSGTGTRVELGMSRGAGAHLLVSNRPRCESRLLRHVDLTGNTVTISAPASCLPAGTWRPRASTVAFKNNYYHAKDSSVAASVRVR